MLIAKVFTYIRAIWYHESALLDYRYPAVFWFAGFFPRDTPAGEKSVSAVSGFVLLMKKSHFMRVSGCHSQQQPYRRELIFRVTAEKPSKKKCIIQQYFLSADNTYCASSAQFYLVLHRISIHLLNPIVTKMTNKSDIGYLLPCIFIYCTTK